MDAHTNFSPEDVFLVSYPKSGNTWMRFLIGNYLTENRCDFTNYHLIIPDIHFNPGRIGQLPYHPRMIKSHFPFTPAYRNVVYIVRDGRDVALSYYFKFIKQRQIRPETRFQDFLEAFNRGGLEGFPSWSSHVASWLDNPPDKFLLVRYEDMKQDTLSELLRVLEFSGLPVNRRAAAAAVAAADFRRMQDLERKQYHLVPQLAHSDPNIPSVRKGTVGESNAYFSDALMAKFLEVHGPVLNRLGYLESVSENRELPPFRKGGQGGFNIILTGIARSGTTLACRLLNKAENIVALNEPIHFGDPNIRAQLRFDNHDRICDATENFFKDMRHLIRTQKLAVSNQVKGILADNNFADYYATDGLRKNLSSRDYIRIEKPLSHDFLLVFNHNGIFTGILESLISRFPVYAMIRNPLAVLASWNSADFDPRHGRSPAEWVDLGLANGLKNISHVTERQLYLLSWFFEKYLKRIPKKFILSYESLIESGGKVLSVIAPQAASLHEPLENKNLNKLYNPEQMLRLGEKLLKSDGAYWEFYSKQSVESLMDVAGRRSQVTGDRSQVAGDRSQVAGHRSQVASIQHPVTSIQQQASSNQHPATSILCEALNSGNSANALKLFEEEISRRPDMPALNYGKAVALARLGRTAEAAETLKHLSDILPEHRKARLLRHQLIQHPEPSIQNPSSGNSHPTAHSPQPIRILHIIHSLSPVGGAVRSMIATAKHLSREEFTQSVISFANIEPEALRLAKDAGISSVLKAPTREMLRNEIEKADIVHAHFWNMPNMYALFRSDLPRMRLLIKFNISGRTAPHIITKPLTEFGDFLLTTNPYAYEHPLFQSLSPEAKSEKLGMIYGAADFTRLAGLKSKPHRTFNVGYIGTVDFIKMHPNYISMSAGIDIPNVRFIVCGEGQASETIRQQTAELGVSERFDFRGYVNDIKPVIEILDVFGYPLCEENYSTVELVLQEIMYAGIPPVIFAHGGAQRTVIHNQTGLIVTSESEYKSAIEYLYHHPKVRKRLGKNAAAYARKTFGGKNAARETKKLYDRLMRLPKQKREWGIPVGIRLLDHPVSPEDIAGSFDMPSGAERFAESLGDRADIFSISMKSQDINELLKADADIAASSPLVAGGIFAYRIYYPEDAYLKLWCGLIHQQDARYDKAASDFTDALKLGCSHWRVSWYLAQAAENAGNKSLAEKAVRDVVAASPDFDPAREMLSRL